ncbi:MAG: DUF1826 domain-containing protein [Proteobacteria bacterium]|jgi:hypothetical protein|nr:DUF1826 domain-containing protein [Pseudomonadota bacterium]
MLCPVVQSGFKISHKQDVFQKILLPEVNTVLWQRSMPHFLEAWAAELNWEKVLPLSAELALSDLMDFEQSLRAEIRGWRKREPDMAAWVAGDMRELVERFILQTGAQEVVAKIEPVTTDMCRLFHTDKNKLRMLCSYLGQGTILLSNDAVAREFLGQGDNDTIIKDPSGISQLNTLDVVILKGESWPDNLIGGAVHRSPPLRVGERRILFKVDFLC